MPRAANDLGDAVAAMCAAGGLCPPERLAVLTMHAAACDAAGQDDPLRAAFTRQRISYAWAATEHPGDVQLQRLRPPSELLVRAVDARELTTAVFETTDAPPGWMERLQQIAEEAGLPRLIRQAARGAPIMAEASSEVLRSALVEVSKFEDPRRLAEGLRFVLGVLNAAQRADELEAMTDHALALSDETPEARAMLLTQLGSAAKDARRPTAFLDRVGERPAGWEAQLSNEWRLSMDTERTSALRMAGRATEAQSVLRPYLGLTFDRDTRWRLEFNLALIDRDAGATDLGLRVLEELLVSAVDDDERFLAHQALARTVTALGSSRTAPGICARRSLALMVSTPITHRRSARRLPASSQPPATPRARVPSWTRSRRRRCPRRRQSRWATASRCFLSKATSSSSVSSTTRWLRSRRQRPEPAAMATPRCRAAHSVCGRACTSSSAMTKRPQRTGRRC
jgi:hypothetical protein